MELVYDYLGHEVYLNSHIHTNYSFLEWQLASSPSPFFYVALLSTSVSFPFLLFLLHLSNILKCLQQAYGALYTLSSVPELSDKRRNTCPDFSAHSCTKESSKFYGFGNKIKFVSFEIDRASCLNVNGSNFVGHKNIIHTVSEPQHHHLKYLLPQQTNSFSKLYKKPSHA